MKKMILSVALMLATFGTVLADETKNDAVEQQKIETVEDVVKLNKQTPYVVSFYDIDKIVIKNDNNSLVRIYDDNWNLIAETTDCVDINVKPGKYFVACDSKIKTQYRSE